ncbi:hypothetical protein HDU76_007518, partial [Blyttiomyces sp. JEL0837]
THIAPKKANLAKQVKLQKKLSAQTIQDTERQMAAKAGATGKLTIMKGVADKAIKELSDKAAKKNKKKPTHAAKIVAAASASSKVVKKSAKK